MKNINRKNALSLLSKLDSASLSSGEHQVLIDLKMLLLERQDLEDACMADLNSYEAWTVWDAKQDVLKMFWTGCAWISRMRFLV